MQIGQPYDRTEMLVKDVQKRVFDVLVSLLLLSLVWPILLSCILMSLAFGGKTFLSKQQYAGKDYQSFRILKVRSSDHVSNKQYKKAALLFGKLRFEKMLLLFKVIRGEMSLVGPEPDIIEAAQKYTRYQSQRLNIRPGLTGYAQIYRHMIQCDDQRLEYDLYYMQHRSIRMDCKILIQSIKLLFRGKVLFTRGV